MNQSWALDILLQKPGARRPPAGVHPPHTSRRGAGPRITSRAFRPGMARVLTACGPQVAQYPCSRSTVGVSRPGQPCWQTRASSRAVTQRSSSRDGWGGRDDAAEYVCGLWRRRP